MTERPRVTYVHTDEKDPLDGTIYEKLSFRSLRFDDWLKSKTADEETILLATFPHRIMLLRYVVGLFVLLAVGGAISSLLEPLYGIPIAVVGVLYLTVGLFRYWSRFYAVTDDNILYKKGSLFTKSAGTTEVSSVADTDIEHSIVARFADQVVRDFGDIRVSTFESGSSDEVRLRRVPEPSMFTEEIANQTYD